MSRPASKLKTFADLDGFLHDLSLHAKVADYFAGELAEFATRENVSPVPSDTLELLFFSVGLVRKKAAAALALYAEAHETARKGKGGGA